MRKVIAVIGVVSIMLSGLALASCGDKPVPKLPTSTATLDKDIRAGQMTVLGIMRALNASLNDVDKFELQLKQSGALTGAQAQQIDALLVSLAKKGKAIDKGIDEGALKDWTMIKNAVDPYIDDINQLQTLTKSGPSAWASIASIVINLALAVLQPAVAAGLAGG